MNISESVQDKIFGYIDAIAEKLGVAAEFVFEALIKQQIIEGATHLSLWFALLVVDVIAIKQLVLWAHRYHSASRALAAKKAESGRYGDYPEEEEQDYAGYWFLGFIVVSSVLSLILLMTGGNVVPDAIGKLLNPEYYALQDIIQAVK